jgi:O-glycosyl hydrolase
MAFKAPDGEVVTELMNSKDKDVEMGVKFHDRVLRLKLPAISITTGLWSSKSAKAEAAEHAEDVKSKTGS